MNTQKHFILVVDDDQAELDRMETILSAQYTVCCISSGQEALEYLRQTTPDLLLLDLCMPQVDGLSVMTWLRRMDNCRNIPVILLLPNDRTGDLRIPKTMALDFIYKPFSPQALLWRIERVLAMENFQHTLRREVDKKTAQLQQSNRRIHALYDQVMRTLANTIDAKDPYTRGHSVRVAEYSSRIAQRMGKTDQEVEDIFYIGLLHDIGKIGIPDTIINKDDRLADQEYAIVKAHPAIGADILKDMTEIPNAAIGAHWHHERFDGKGYPDGLAGEDIPEAARIIGVADAYDAMTSRRRYQQIMPQEAVRTEIARGRGTQFDPAITDIMLAMIDEDKDYQMREK